MNRTIKVIKKNAQENTREVEKKAPEPRFNSKQKARDMVSTVANWVTDIQSRKRTETKTALENFFKTPRPSES